MDSKKHDHLGEAGFDWIKIQSKPCRAFTLIELLVVIAIIAILAASVIARVEQGKN